MLFFDFFAIFRSFFFFVASHPGNFSADALGWLNQLNQLNPKAFSFCIGKLH